MKLLFLFTLFVFFCHFGLADFEPIVPAHQLAIINNLKEGQCIDKSDWSTDSTVIPDLEFSGLHPHPDFSGCYPRILIDGVPYGLVFKTMVEEPPYRELCRYFEIDDLVEQKSTHFSCSMWPTD